MSMNKAIRKYINEFSKQVNQLSYALNIKDNLHTATGKDIYIFLLNLKFKML